MSDFWEYLGGGEFPVQKCVPAIVFGFYVVPRALSELCHTLLSSTCVRDLQNVSGVVWDEYMLTASVGRQCILQHEVNEVNVYGCVTKYYLILNPSLKGRNDTSPTHSWLLSSFLSLLVYFLILNPSLKGRNDTSPTQLAAFFVSFTACLFLRLLVSSKNVSYAWFSSLLVGLHVTSRPI